MKTNEIIPWAGSLSEADYLHEYPDGHYNFYSGMSAQAILWHLNSYCQLRDDREWCIDVNGRRWPKPEWFEHASKISLTKVPCPCDD